MVTTKMRSSSQKPGNALPEGSRKDDREEFARNIFETVREPLVALTADLRVWLANRAFYECFRVTPHETEHKLIFELGNGQWDIPKLRTLLEEIIPRNESFEDFEVEHAFEQIGRKVMLLNARRINDGSLILLAIEDITERKRLNDELEAFAQVAAHDLGEPRRMVAQYLTLLEKRPNRHDRESNEFIHFAVDGARRMSALIKNLLSYSSIGTPERLGPVNLNLAFHHSLSNLESAISEAQATVTKDELPTLRGDSTEFEQLLQNLIANGIKYRGEAPPKVHVSAARKGGQWLFSVMDNGVGIAPENHERIFTPFLRLHSRVERAGTGLGLSTCKKIVESHGGRTWVESEPGRGSTFFFTIPVESA